MPAWSPRTFEIVCVLFEAVANDAPPCAGRTGFGTQALRPPARSWQVKSPCVSGYYSRSLSLSHTHSLSLTHTHAHTHTHTHTLASHSSLVTCLPGKPAMRDRLLLALALSRSLSLSLSLSFALSLSHRRWATRESILEKQAGFFAFYLMRREGGARSKVRGPWRLSTTKGAPSVTWGPFEGGARSKVPLCSCPKST